MGKTRMQKIPSVEQRIFSGIRTVVIMPRIVCIQKPRSSVPFLDLGCYSGSVGSTGERCSPKGNHSPALHHLIRSRKNSPAPKLSGQINRQPLMKHEDVSVACKPSAVPQSMEWGTSMVRVRAVTGSGPERQETLYCKVTNGIVGNGHMGPIPCCGQTERHNWKHYLQTLLEGIILYILHPHNEGPCRILDKGSWQSSRVQFWEFYPNNEHLVNWSKFTSWKVG